MMMSTMLLLFRFGLARESSQAVLDSGRRVVGLSDSESESESRNELAPARKSKIILGHAAKKCMSPAAVPGADPKHKQKECRECPTKIYPVCSDKLISQAFKFSALLLFDPTPRKYVPRITQMLLIRFLYKL